MDERTTDVPSLQYILTCHNIYTNKRPHSANLLSSFNCSQTNGNAALQNKDPFDGVIEADFGDSAAESFMSLRSLINKPIIQKNKELTN